MEAYQRAVDLDPDDFEFYDRRDIFLSSEYKQDDRVTQMVGNWEQYLARHPGDVDILLALARLYVAKRRYDTVVDVAKRILDIEPEHKKARRLLESARRRSEKSR